MKFFSSKFKCEQCKSKFAKYEELINHARHIHQHPIVKCSECGKEFIHEADRLHHVRKEREEKMERRIHKSEHKHEQKKPSPQDDVDKHTRNFSDNF